MLIALARTATPTALAFAITLPNWTITGNKGAKAFSKLPSAALT